MLLKIGDKTYKSATIDRLTLADIIFLQGALTQYPTLSTCRNWGDIKALVKSWDHMDNRTRAEHPEGLFLVGLVIWASRRTAGEKVDFLDALDVAVTDVTFLPEPGDRKPASAEGKAPKGSGRAAGNRQQGKAKPRTSKKPSPAASSS